MTLTLDIDKEIVERARELAKLRGRSLEAMVTDYVRDIACAPKMTPEEAKQMVEDLERMWATSHGDSRGEKWTRDEIHDRSKFR